MNITELPNDILHLIVMFLVRNITAEIIINSHNNNLLKLNHLQYNKFNKHSKYVWHELHPNKLMSTHYGDKIRISRINCIHKRKTYFFQNEAFCNIRSLSLNTKNIMWKS